MNDWNSDPLNYPSTLAKAVLPTAEEVMQGLREPVIAADAEFTVQCLNPAAERLLGVAAGASLGRPLQALVPGRYSAAEPEVGGGWRLHRWRDGWLAYGPGGGPGDEAVLQRMVEAEQLMAVGQLAAGIAHEIGAPLTAISVAVEYLLKSTPSQAADVRRDLDLVLAQTQRISRLTRRLVDLAKPVEPEFRPTDLNTIVRESAEFVERQLRRDGVECDLVLDGALPQVRGDSHQLQQVLLNLLLNAHRAVLTCPAGQRRIEVRSGCRRDGVELVVADSGPGLEPEDMHRIFLPFFSLAGSTGMGLTVVWNIVHQHEGTIEARSQPGQGASFHVWLPVADHGQGG
jgi:signal transduction histidine kinase